MEAGGTVQEAKKQGGAGGDQDLSMEEILQSIRRIIAEDDGEKTSDAPANSVKADEEVPGSDVLELTEMLKEDGSIVNVKDEPAAAAVAAAPATTGAAAGAMKETPKESPNDVLAMINEALTPPADAAKEEPAEPKAAMQPAAMPAMAAAPSTASVIDSLLSTEAAAAAAAQFKRLQTNANAAADVHVPSPPFRSGTTVEDLVTEMLRPMMKDWLDNNLPQIVERIVEREVHKLTK